MKPLIQLIQLATHLTRNISALLHNSGERFLFESGVAEVGRGGEGRGGGILSIFFLFIKKRKVPFLYCFSV